MELISANDLSYDSLSHLVNRTYKDYYFPVWMDEVHFEQMCYQEDVDLRHSVVAVDDEQPVGIALLSIREDQGWVSGVGVLSSWQRRGIARQIVQRLQTTARAVGLHALRLEVLVQNNAARELYRQSGFTCERDLLILLLEAWSYRPKPLPPGVVQAAADVLLASYAAFHDVPSPWQRQLPSVQHRVASLRGFGLWEGEILAGYVLYSIQAGNYSIIDLAVSPAHPRRVEVARTLLRALHDTYADMRRYVFTNLPTDDPLLPAFTGLGYGTWYRQHELVWRAS